MRRDPLVNSQNSEPWPGSGFRLALRGGPAGPGRFGGGCGAGEVSGLPDGSVAGRGARRSGESFAVRLTAVETS